MLEEEQCLLHNRVHVHLPLLPRAGPGKVEQAVDDAAAALHLCVDDLEVFLLRVARGGRELLAAQRQRLAAGEDRSERVVDLVHDTSSELAHRRQLLGLGQALLRLAPLGDVFADGDHMRDVRSEEHTSELQSPYDLVCRLLLEKKKKSNKTTEAVRI